MVMLKRPEDHVRRMLEQTLVPSPHVTELRTDALGSASNRFAHARGNAAERAHGSSRLYSFNIERQSNHSDTSSLIRDWFFETGRDGAKELARLGSEQVRDISSLPNALRACLSPYAEVGPTIAPLFSCDIVVNIDGALWRLVPGTKYLTFEGMFSSSDATQVAEALEAWPPVDPESVSFCFVVGAFSRAQHVLGERAHRHTSVQAGRIGGSVEAAWLYQQRPDEIFLSSDSFIDEAVEQPLRVDGVERAVLLVMAICSIEFERSEQKQDVSADLVQRDAEATQ